MKPSNDNSSTTKNLNPASMSERIYQSLKWSLTIGEYFPGSSLSIRSLAAKMGTSPMPVREALTRLASERLLDSSIKRSYKVPQLNAKRVSDQFFLRARLEGIATRLAVPNLTAAQIEELEVLAKMMDKDITRASNENYIVRNYNFHFTIYAASQNEELFWTIERLWAQTGPYLAQIVRSQTMPEEWKNLHTQISEAIKSRNSEQAGQLIEKDISWGVATFEAHVDSIEKAKASPVTKKK